jgi:hypothetical protein
VAQSARSSCRHGQNRPLSPSPRHLPLLATLAQRALLWERRTCGDDTPNALLGRLGVDQTIIEATAARPPLAATRTAPPLAGGAGLRWLMTPCPVPWPAITAPRGLVIGRSAGAGPVAVRPHGGLIIAGRVRESGVLLRAGDLLHRPEAVTVSAFTLRGLQNPRLPLRARPSPPRH